MNGPFLALITPIGGGGGAPGGGGGAPGYPTHPWVPPWRPTHPIAPGGPPPGIWGPIGNYPDAGFPAPQPPPLGIWGGGGVGNYPDAGFPGPQPGGPTHIWGGPWYPPVIWPGPGPLPGIEHPIAPGGEGVPKIEWKTAWSPTTGWIVVGVPTGEHVTPSAQEPGA